MKTVTGALVDSDPVSLSKAAKILFKFSSADNGASPAFLHYLMRSSDAFDELVQLHKELSGSGSERRRKKRRSGIQVEEPVNSVVNYGEATKAGADGERPELGKVNGVVKKEGESTIGNSVDSKSMKKEKKKIKKELGEEGRSNGGYGISSGMEEEIEGKKNKKMKNGSEVEDRENKTPDFRQNGNKINQIHEGGGRDGKTEKKLSKKRKSGEIGVDGEGADSANKGMQSKKRKKVKSEGDN